jgi:hypothetical protein
MPVLLTTSAVRQRVGLFLAFFAEQLVQTIDPFSL